MTAPPEPSSGSDPPPTPGAGDNSSQTVAPDREADWASRLLTALAWLYAVAIPSIFVAGIYYRQPVTKQLSFQVADGWCNPHTQGLGAHCFSDFQFPRVVQGEPSVWSNSLILPHPYTATAMFPHVVAKRLEDAFLGVRGSLLVYLAALAACLLVPSIWAACRGGQRLPRMVLIAMLGAMSLPLLVVLDRGNSIGFAIPFVLLFCVYLDREPSWVAPVAVIVAASIRPQFGLIALAFLVVGRFRALLSTVAGFTVVFFVSFTIWSGDPARDIRDWSRALSGFQDSQSLMRAYPVNLSAARSLVAVDDAVRHLFGGFGGTSSSFAVWIDAHANVIGAVMLLITAGVIVWLRDRLPVATALIVVLSLPILVPAFSYGYYLAVVLVIAALLVSPMWTARTDRGEGLFVTAIHEMALGRVWAWAVVLTTAISLVPLPFVFASGRQAVVLEIAGPMWTAVWAVSIFGVVAPPVVSWIDTRHGMVSS